LFLRGINPLPHMATWPDMPHPARTDRPPDALSVYHPGAGHRQPVQCKIRFFVSRAVARRRVISIK
jgi:hypothetical protein